MVALRMFGLHDNEEASLTESAIGRQNVHVNRT
jgi:hypothetical protein